MENVLNYSHNSFFVKKEVYSEVKAKVIEIENYLHQLQDSICQQLLTFESKQTFQKDEWQRPGGGGGRTYVLENGDVFERAGVNVSHVHGEQLPPSATKKRPELTGCEFRALGLSLVFHPRNPFAPTTHLNVRFFIAYKENADPIWWFGGGFDLTPYYGFDEDVIHWHGRAKQACDPFGEDVYSRYKKWCDEYFYLAHRNEPRGIGGLFFDDLNEWDFDQCFAFMRSVGDNFIPAYFPIVEKRKDTPYTQQQRDFQCYRRGRYVEFNLVYDRGTLFGLQSNGRIESILVSMPPVVNWRYQYQPTPGSEEAKLYDYYLQPRDWLAINLKEKA